MPAVVDTSFLVAAMRETETNHAAAVRALDSVGDDALLVPVTIVSETMCLLGARWGVYAQRRFWDALLDSGMEIVPVDAAMMAAARGIDEAYGDASLGFIDCTLLATCEARRVARVLSFDRRLAAYRPTFSATLEVLP